MWIFTNVRVKLFPIQLELKERWPGEFAWTFESNMFKHDLAHVSEYFQELELDSDWIELSLRTLE
jgi:hypothetical protein